MSSSKLDEEAGIFPWKHREILTFRIPLDESHSSGLGVSVKGKSTSTANGSVDLGIFIKSVISGGAAAKDGHLLTNDQLVNINGISLLGMSNSNAMETLRNAMTQSDGPLRNAIILTIARRISQPSDENNGSVISDHSIPITTSENIDSAENKSNSLQNRNHMLPDLDIVKNNSVPPGCNPVIERLTGQNSNDIYGYTRHDKIPQINLPDTDEKNKMTYSATMSSNKTESVIIEGEYDPTLKKLGNYHQQSTSTLAESESIAPAGSQLSLDDANPGFARDGFGRQSMSEKRHAQLDARSTDTYQRSKKAREERDRYRHLFTQEFCPDAPQSSSKESEEALGPSLGLRKSSSLESLQTMIQELNKDDEAMKRAMQPGNARSSRSRGCNESFRAAVDRSYDAPATSTMETLDEESESGSSLLTRSAELVDHDDLLNMYCRNSKSSKKKSLLKGLGSVFKFGRNRKQSQDPKGKADEDYNHEGEYSSTHQNVIKEQDRSSEVHNRESDMQKRQLPQIPKENSALSLDSMPNRQERMQSLREQHQRMHQRRQGQYPLEQKEEYYENVLKEKESKYALPYEVIHSRSHSLDIHKDSSQAKNVPSFGGENNRYSHYMNYKEIQQHIHQRIQHDPLRNSATKTEAQTEGPTPKFFDYDSVHQRHPINQTIDSSCNSLPRSERSSDSVNKPYFQHETGSYGRMGMHHFYPNNKHYSHIVPGSKV